MVADDRRQDERVNSLAIILKTIAYIVFFPFLWIGVGFNFFGLAERFSFLPGVSREGGLWSAAIALIVTSIALAIIAAGAVAASGLNFQDIDDDDVPPVTPTKTPTPRQPFSPTTTAAPTPTKSPIETTESLTELESFEQDYRGRVTATLENDSLTGVPVLGTAYRQTKNGDTELWVVFWQCDQLEPQKNQRVTLGNSVVGTVAEHVGERPSRVRIYGVTNHANQTDTITHITTESAEQAYIGTMSPENYTQNWYDRLHEPSPSESEVAFEIAVNDSGEEKAYEAFNQHHPDVRGCPGGVKNRGSE